MRLFPHLRVAFLGLCLAAAASFTEHIVRPLDRAIERVVDFVLSAFTPAPRLIATDGPSIVLREDRAPLAASLLEGLRHEKGVPRFGAARNI